MASGPAREVSLGPLACSHHVSQVVDVGGSQMESQMWCSHLGQVAGVATFLRGLAHTGGAAVWKGEPPLSAAQAGLPFLGSPLGSPHPVFSECCPGPRQACPEVICGPVFLRQPGPVVGDTPGQSRGFPETLREGLGHSSWLRHVLASGPSTASALPRRARNAGRPAEGGTLSLATSGFTSAGWTAATGSASVATLSSESGSLFFSFLKAISFLQLI